MSTDSRQPNENQEVNQPVSQNPPENPKLPVPRAAMPASHEELSEEKRKRLEELAERANAAHDLAKDAAIRFCRHSIEAGMALLVYCTAQSETTTSSAFEEERTLVVEAAAPPRLSDHGDLLAKASSLFNELLAVLRQATESGQALDYGQFVLDELERLRGDLDVCRLLIRDAHLGASTPV
jgi:hypothetical protein